MCGAAETFGSERAGSQKGPWFQQSSFPMRRPGLCHQPSPTARRGAEHLLPASPPHASGFAMTKDWLPCAVQGPAAGWRSSHLTGTAAARFPLCAKSLYPGTSRGFGEDSAPRTETQPQGGSREQSAKQPTDNTMPQRCTDLVTFLGPTPTGDILIWGRARRRGTEPLLGLFSDDAEEGREFVELVPIHASSSAA